MKIRFLILVLTIVIGANAQNPDVNYAKYQRFRTRLTNEFMYFSGDAGVRASHLPMENIYYVNGRKIAYWADATWWQGHYVAVLATEYALKKRSGENTDRTLEELRLALAVYDRLDCEAESCWNGRDTLNGFYLRDDVAATDTALFHVNGIYSDYLYNCGHVEKIGNSPSQDQAWATYLGLALAKKLVDDDSVQCAVASIATRIVRVMQFTDEKGRPHWQIVNPVTGKLTQKEGDIQWLQYPHGEIGSMLSGQNLHFGKSGKANWKNIWNILQNNVLIDGDGHFTWYGVMLLSTVMNEGGAGSPNCYEWLVKTCEKIVRRHPEMGQTLFFPHLPLANLVLYGKNGKTLVDKSLYEQYLDAAPADGIITKSVKGETVRTDAPWHTLSLFCPWHNQTTGDANMIDYMLLYNLYRLVYE